MKSLKPINFIENKIKLLLCLSGYNQKDIQFDVIHGENQRFVRVNYWSFLKDKAIHRVQDNINVLLVPESHWDEDCGWKTCYKILITDRKEINNGSI